MSESNARDTTAIASRLCHVFNHACQDLPRAERTAAGPNELYKLQTEFAYLLHELQMGPKAMYQKNLTDLRSFLEENFSNTSRSTTGN